MSNTLDEKNAITHGPLYSSFIKYFIPILLGSLIQQSYTFVDALIIGNFAGKGALAAIDAPYAYIKLLINAFIALSTGGTIIVSQYYGAKENNKLEEIISSLIRFSLIGGIIISIIGIVFAPNFINIMLIPDDIYGLSLSYLRVYFAGTIFVFTFNIASGILRALGDSKNPSYYLMVSSILNILLDLIFVAIFKWSVAGVALATIMAQGLAMILVLRKVKSLGYHFKKPENLESLKKTLRLGSPMTLQSILFSIANMFMQRGINSFGTDSIAGWSICGKADFIIWSLADTMGVAVTTFVAQNYGAKNRDRMNKSVRYGLLTSIATVGVISLVLFVFIKQIATLFTKDQAAIESAVYLMRLTSPYYIFYAFGEVFAGGIKGRGNTVHPMLITLVGTCIFRVTWVQIVTKYAMSLKNIISGYPWSWFVTASIFAIYYFIVVYIRKSKEKL
ncbi:MAG: MATE family efflux transporter [Treponemataceae bacterium]